MSVAGQGADRTTTIAEATDAASQVMAVWQGGSIRRALDGAAPLVVGRSAGCDLTVDHPSVSRRHARLLFTPALQVEDLGSSNGTRVRGALVKPHQPTSFTSGEVIQVGSTLLVVHLSAAHRGPEPAPGRAAAEPLHGVASQGPEMGALDRLVSLVAPTDISVLITGETGAGKDVMASLVHARSRRAGGPFVQINCAAIPEPLFESELFGHVRGAFTGAIADKPGLIERAHGGTLLLDEVGELPPQMQAKLLRVLETGEVARVGAPRSIRADVRLLSATNADLAAMLASGRFRSDLYFRLNGITLRIPPLRERPGEIVPLARAFLAESSVRLGRPAPEISPRALGALAAYTWPGNVRELRNVMDRAAALSQGATVEAEHLLLDVAVGRPEPAAPPPSEPAPITVRGEDAARRLHDDLDEVTRRRIVDALEQCSGNQSEAARLLGISRRTLTSRLDEYGLPRPRKDKKRT